MSNKRTLILGTRASRLAMAQSRWVAERLQERWPSLQVELRPITTGGDRGSPAFDRALQGAATGDSGRAAGDDRPAGAERAPAAGDRVATAEGAAAADRVADLEITQVGVFVKELEAALLTGEIDLAVHSLKDVPTSLPEGLVIGAVPRREDPRDVLVLPSHAGPAEKGEGRTNVPPAGAGAASGARAGARAGAGTETGAEESWYWLLEQLPQGTRLGTGSLRRLVQMAGLRPDLRSVPIRGNVDTRLTRLDQGRCDLLVLAAAGLRRLGLENRIAAFVPVHAMVPAPGQGALALECREEDLWVLERVRAMDDPLTRAAVWAERGFMRGTEAGCRLPVGAVAVPGTSKGAEGMLTLHAFLAVAAGDGGRPGAGAGGPSAETRWLWTKAQVVLDMGGAGLLPEPEACDAAGERVALWLRGRIAAGNGQLVELAV